MRPALKLLDGATATNGKPSNTAATGSITAAAGNTITTGTSFVLDDGINPLVQFVFDSASAVTATATRKVITYTSADNAATIKAAIISAVNGVTTGLAITASDGGGVIVTLTNDYGGTHGNTVLANTTSLTMSGMTGGVDAGFTLNGTVAGTPYHWPLLDAGILCLASVAGSGTMTVTVRIWLYDILTKTWAPAGNDATVANRGLLNGGNAIGEDGADKLIHKEPIDYLSGSDRIYAEITAIGGTATAVDLYLNSTAKQIAQ